MNALPPIRLYCNNILKTLSVHHRRLDLRNAVLVLNLSVMDLVSLRMCDDCVHLSVMIWSLVLNVVDIHGLKRVLILRSIHLNLRSANISHDCGITTFKILVLYDLRRDRGHTVLN